MLRLHPKAGGHRRGNILIVTLLLLALFATIGLTIVYYTKDLAERERITIEAQSNGASSFPDDGTGSLNAFLSALIYEPSNTNSFIYGQSLMRTMYGGQVGGTSPWNGVGSFHETVAAVGLDRAQILNYGMVNAMGITGVSPETSTAGVYIPKNAPYTYPDLKDFYLASICPATGEVLVPSYQRLAGFGKLDSTNPNWTNTQGMYMTPRPRPFDNGGATSSFPSIPMNGDGTFTGDVQNLPGGYYGAAIGQFPAHNDSIWIDIGMPTIPLPNGKMVKPLVAPLVVDLDGLLNISVHGNVYSAITSTPIPNGGSGVGIGPWEVNLVRALPTDGLTLISNRGSPQTASGITTRSYNPRLPSGQQLPAYGAVAWNTGGGANPLYPSLNLPGSGTNSVYATSPLYSPTATAPYSVGYDSTNSTITNPAILFNPSEWPSTYGSSPRSYPLSDLKQLMGRYCATPSNYAYPQLDLNNQTLTTIRGTPSTYLFPTPTGPGVLAPQSNTASSYRLDPANLNRGLLTPYSWSLDRQGFNTNFPVVSATNALTWTAGTSLTGGTLSGPAATAYSTTATGTSVALGPLDLNRPLADYRLNTSLPLSPTNMNTAVATTVSWPSNATQGVTQAVADRQQFAMSIFARLILASGGLATFTSISGTGESVTITATAGSAQFYALQALAQLAANIVDYIDSDDVSTVFVWNSTIAGDPFNVANFTAANMGNCVVFGVESPRLLLNEAYGEIVNDPNDPAFTNATTKASTAPQIRFWLELINPTSTPYTGTGSTTCPLGSGAVTVRYTSANATGLAASYSPYQIQIVRSDPGNAANVNVSDVLRNPANPSNPGNVTGGIVGTPADITFNFSSADTLASTNSSIYTVLPSNGAPNTTQPTITAQSILICAANVQTPPTNGPDFIFPNGNTAASGALGSVNATTTTPPQNVINAAPPTAANQAAGTTLTYSATITQANASTLSLVNALQNNGANGVSTDLLQHVVLLQRLANPYLPYSTTNPYITVDYMDYVPAADRILLANGSTTATGLRKPYNSKTSTSGFNPNPASLGKVQPYANWTPAPTTQFQPPNGNYATGLTPGTWNFSFPSSMILGQRPTTAVTQTPVPGSSATAVQHTFGQFNSITPASPPTTATYMTTATATPPAAGTGSLTGNETIMTPIDWITQLDRNLVNQFELFPVSVGKPHELTLRSIVPNNLAGGTDVYKFGNTAGQLFTSTSTTLYRAMDLLRVQPYGQMTGLGGRVPGRININTIQDKRVWDALFDAQPWNTFAQTDVSTMWTSLIGSRTASAAARYSPSGTQLTDTSGTTYSTPLPGQVASVYDVPPGTTGTFDRPFVPFGTPTYTAGGSAYAGGVGLNTDTLARGGTIFTASNNGVGSGSPYICSASNGFLVPHPYVQPETLRKITNNTTTVSHTFAVWVTVGYFNVTGTSSMGLPQLGSEYYSLVPGDLRKKFFAVVDRSLVGLTPGTTTHSQNQPFFTAIDGTSPLGAGSTLLPITTSGPSQISVNGNLMAFPSTTTPGLGNTLAVGSGATQEVVTVTAAGTYTNNGTMAYTTYTIVGSGAGGGFMYPHWPGETVSNIVPGNPGAQPNFSITSSSLNIPYNYVVPYWSRLQ